MPFHVLWVTHDSDQLCSARSPENRGYCDSCIRIKLLQPPSNKEWSRWKYLLAENWYEKVVYSDLQCSRNSNQLNEILYSCLILVRNARCKMPRRWYGSDAPERTEMETDCYWCTTVRRAFLIHKFKFINWETWYVPTTNNYNYFLAWKIKLSEVEVMLSLQEQELSQNVAQRDSKCSPNHFSTTNTQHLSKSSGKRGTNAT